MEASHTPQLTFINHKVQYSGETLGIIAAWYTGNAQNWKRLVEANPQIKPNKIRIGEIIRIPHALVVQEKPLPVHIIPGATKKSDIKNTAEKAGAAMTDKEKVSSTEVDLTKKTTEGKNTITDAAVEKVNPSAPSTVKEKSLELDVAVPAKTKEVQSKEDAERERLLDELLRQ